MALSGGDTSSVRPVLGRWRFGVCVLDEQLAAVSIAGTPVELDRSSYDVLLALLRHAGEVVTKDELLEAGWPGRIVTDNSLAKAVSRLRQTLAADGEAIRAVHGYGYRLTALVRHEASAQGHASATAAQAPELREGDALPSRPGWRLRKRLGEGSAGVIYLAAANGATDVAVKFASSEAGLRSLKREIALHRYISASNGALRDVAPVLAWNLKEPPYFLEMPHYAGGNLIDWAAARGGLDKVPLAERIAMCANLCDTIAKLHELGVLHKDLKPANLYPVSDANGTRLVLADLGVAETTSAPQMVELGLTFSLPMTTDGHLSPAGSLLYVAPEVIGGGVATQHSDVYALGVILFQMCVADLRSSLAPGWEQRIDDALLREDIAAAAALEPEQRPDARGLSVRLCQLFARRLARTARLQQDVAIAAQAKALVAVQQRRRLWLMLSAGLLVGLLVALWMYQQADSARTQAQRVSGEKQAVVDFLAKELLTQADPYATDRSDITLRAAVDIAAGKIDRDFGEQPDVAIELHKAIADVYAGLSQYEQGGQQFRLAMKDYARAHDTTSHAYADLAISLCAMLRQADDFANAALACDEGNNVLARLGEASGKADLETGKLRFEQGRCREALAPLARVPEDSALDGLAGARRLRVPIGEASHYKALCLQELGRIGAAESAFQQSIASRRSTYGAHSLYLAWALSDFGYFLVETGKFAQAQPVLDESHEIFAAGLPEDDPDRYGPEYAFALMRLYAHDWHAAIDLMEPIYVAEKKRLGEAHLWPLMTQSDLAWAKAAAGMEPAGSEELDNAMALAKAQLTAFGTRSSFLVDRWIRAALALHRDDQARELIEQQQGLVRELDPHHLRAAMLPCYRAQLILHDRGSSPDGVIGLANQCRAELLAVLPADHPLVKDAEALSTSVSETSRR